MSADAFPCGVAPQDSNYPWQWIRPHLFKNSFLFSGHRPCQFLKGGIELGVHPTSVASWIDSVPSEFRQQNCIQVDQGPSMPGPVVF